MPDNWPRDHADDHGSREHEPEVLSLQSAVAKQRRDKRRLHAKPGIEQRVEHDES
jgi:hypothetical protein